MFSLIESIKNMFAPTCIMTQAAEIAAIRRELKQIEKQMVTREELDSWVETLEVLSNEDTMRQIRESEKDFAEGRFEEITSVYDMLE